MIIEAKRGSIWETMKQCLLSLKDAGENNGGGEVYGFLTTGDSWRMVRYDEAFRMTEKIDTLFYTMDEARQRWVNDYSVVVDCMYMVVTNGGLWKRIWDGLWIYIFCFGGRVCVLVYVMEMEGVVRESRKIEFIFMQ